MRSCNSNHASWATSLQLEDPNCAVSALFSRRNTNTCSWRWMSCQEIPPFEWLLSLDPFCTSQCVATFFWFTCFQNPVENHFWCPIGLLYAINRGQNDPNKCAQHGSWLTFFGPVDLSLRLNSFLLSFRLLTNEQPHPMPNQNTQSKQSRDTWKNNFSTSQDVVKRCLFLCLQNFTFWVSPIGDVFHLRFRDKNKTCYTFRKQRDYHVTLSMSIALWPVKGFCWILPAFGFGHLVGKAGYRFRLMLSVVICAISSK